MRLTRSRARVPAETALPAPAVAAVPGEVPRKGRGERGASAIIFAITLPILIVMIAFVVDFGYAYYSKQRLQDALDLAAIAAARELSETGDVRAKAQTAALGVLQSNGYDAVVVNTFSFGRYDRRRALLDRFVAEGAGATDTPTAVRIEGTSESPRFFSRIIASDMMDVGARSTAVTTGRYATVRIGSGLAGLNNGLLNAILGALLGSSVNLTALDYNGLVGANVDLLGFLDQYAIKLGLDVGDYDSLLSADASVLGVLGLAADLAQNAAAGDPTALGLGLGLGDAFPGISKLPLVNLQDVNIKLGDLLGVALGTADAGLAVPVNLFELVTAGIFAASTGTDATGQHAVSASLGTFLGASLDVSVVEQQQPPSGMRVITEQDILDGNNLLRTAQIRILLQVDLSGPLGSAVSGLNALLSLLQLVGVEIQLLPGATNISVGISVAPAQVVVTELGCSPPNAPDRYVGMDIDTGLLT
ncbi:MAG: pilus assembly protein TadG-related protein, partial [Zavarzinia sp.]|nr:pilus assembly protein TadG-related protein [Zavarzinia sp.]